MNERICDVINLENCGEAYRCLVGEDQLSIWMGSLATLWRENEQTDKLL
jgi:hypothetical protein